MSTYTRRPLTRAIQQILRQPVTTIRPLQYATPHALLSLLLASQPALAAAKFDTKFDTKFVEVPRQVNPLMPPIDVGRNSKPTFVDIDNDGDLDVFIGADDGTVKYYENTNTANNPIFTERTTQNNPLSDVSMKNGRSSPTLVDIDNDNDFDAFIGGKDGTVKYYENTGDVNKPIFQERTEQDNPFNGIDVPKGDRVPFLVDIDNDGDLDAFVGLQIGTVEYYENTGEVNRPIFEERTDTANPLGDFNVEKNSTVNFVDIDNDSDLDAFIGASNGTVKYHKNTGSANRPVFEERTDTANPLHGVEVGNNSAPALIDIDKDSDLDAFIGTGDGTVKYYENQGTIEQPDFVARIKLDNPFGGIVDASPALVDIDNDGDLDLFTGNFDGPLRYYQNEGTISQPKFVERTNQNNPFNGVSMGNSATLSDIDNDGDLDAFIGSRVNNRDNDGEIVTSYDTIKYYENTGSSSLPVFDERTDTLNPLSKVNIKNISNLVLVDIDQDRDLDAFIKESAGPIRYYENTGSISHPFFVERPQQNHPLGDVVLKYDSIPTLIYNGGSLNAVIVANDGTIKYYEKQGTDFEERIEQNNPFADIVAADRNSLPIFVDIDNDGDLDAIIGADDGTVKYYQNISNVNKPAFVERFGQDNPLANVEFFSEPSWVDIDNDSDLDVFIGTNYGTVKHYENTGTISQPFFVERTEQNNPLADVEVGFYCTPTMVDIDNDSDLDAFIGAQDGTVRYYENIGISQPNFEERTKQNNPLVDAKVDSSSQPRLIDIDNDGDLDAIISGTAHDEGGNVDTVKYYENISTDNSPRFVELTALNNLLADIINAEFTREPPTLVDIDHDGDLDAFIIDRNEQIVRYYENTGTVSQPRFLEHIEQNELLAGISVNPFVIPSTLLVDVDNDEDLDAFIGGKVDGKNTVKYYENTGTVSQPNFVWSTTQQDYLQILKGYPTWVDLDNDNDLDAFFKGEHPARYYENISLASNALPNNYALPKGRLYNSKREVSLNCIDCEKIYYTLDGTKPTINSLEYVAPLEIAQNTTINFVTVDAQSKLSKVQTETYLIDTTLPEITINSPASNSTVEVMPSIQGTAFEPEDGVELERIELQVNNGPLYISRDSNNPFTTSLTWLPITTENDQWSYDVSEAIPSFPTGNYTITARAFDRAGNVAEDSINVTIGEPAHTELFIELNSRAILKGGTLNVTGKLNRFPESDEDLSGLPIELTIIAPDGTTRTETTETHSNTGQYEFIDLDGFTQQGKYRFKTTFAGASLLKESKSNEESVLVGKSAGYAIIVQGKLANEEGLAAHNKTTNRIYHKLKEERGFEDDNIYYFHYNPDTLGVNDKTPSKKAIQAAFADLPDKINGSPGPFYLIMVDHGGREGHFYIDNDGDNETITPQEIAEWLNMLEQGLGGNALAEPRIVILGYCYSGSFIPELSGSNRVIITSAAADEVSYKGPKEPDDIRTGEFFMEAFFQRLGRGASFKDAFETATERTEIYTRRGGPSANLDNPYFDNAVQHPLVDINGDGQGSNVLSAEIGEGPNLAELYLGAGADFVTNPGSAAEIIQVTDTVYLTPKQSSADLYIKVNNANRVNGAPVDIRQPSIVLTTDDPDEYTEQREIEGVLRVDGDLRCSHVTDYCDKTVEVFEEPGQYEVFYFVRDSETDDISPIKRSVVYKNKAGNQAPESFELLYPFEGVEPPPATTLRFYWDDTNDPDNDAFTYTLLIATDEEDFDNSVVYKQEELRVTTTSINHQTNVIDEETGKSRQGLKDLTKYYWAVEAIDNFGARTSSNVFSFTPDNTNAPPSPGSADPKSILGNSIAIDGEWNGLATKAVFYFTMVNGDWVLLGSTLSEPVVMMGHITVDPDHWGQTADILTVIRYTPADGEEAQFFMMDVKKQYQPWDVDLAKLVAREKSITLPVSYTVPIDSGEFVGIGAGDFRVFYGYRLENGVIVYNEVQPVVKNEPPSTTD